MHALAPKPGAALTMAGPDADASDATPLKVLRATTTPFEAGETPAPGTIELDDGEKRLRIATGEDWLVPLVLQRAGGKALETEAFLRGFALPEGAHAR